MTELQAEQARVRHSTLPHRIKARALIAMY